MKEKIYTIPVNEAFEQNCECALCFLEQKLEEEAVEYSLGAAMMEPDFRILSNDKGFCRHHYSMMFKKQNKLSLSLILDTHLEEYRKKLSDLDGNIALLSNKKKSLFKKSSSEAFDLIGDTLKKTENSCVTCEKVNNTVKRYVEVIFYLWKNDAEFKKKILNSKGFCMPHFALLFNSAFEHLDTKNASEFSRIIYDKELSELARIQEDIHRFTLKFDYRNKDMELGDAIDAPIRTIEKLAGYINKD